MKKKIKRIAPMSGAWQAGSPLPPEHDDNEAIRRRHVMGALGSQMSGNAAQARSEHLDEMIKAGAN